jgi:hypothetical protein
MKNSGALRITTPTDREIAMTHTMLYASKAVRDAVLQSPMEHGVAASYDNPRGAAGVDSGPGRPVTVQTAATSAGPRRRLRSAAAVLLGFFTVVVLSIATDQVLHALGVYPPWGQPMNDPGLNLLALAYRSVYAVLGSYLAARAAPEAPMRHALALGFIGLVLSVVGAIVAIGTKLGPSWYPVALAVTTLPCAWLGGVLRRVGQARH